ncbi:MAG: YcaO-like family protein [Endozoicomonas sp.]|uniref:YcaO-like family protein n=1 Tax=Endozoicomonas sp. TaxID=1892382 RepID=UPI003D9B1224
MSKKYRTSQGALALWQKVCQQQGFSSIELEAGQCSIVELTDPEMGLTTRGSGKGNTKAEAQISASYEAFELLCCQRQSLRTDEQVESLTLHTIETNSFRLLGLPQHFCPEFLDKNNEYYAKPLPYLPFRQEINGDPETAFMPMAAAEWSYASSCSATMKNYYARYLFMATTSGVASGLNYDDALVHGITELIERDALAGFLIRHCLQRKPASSLQTSNLSKEIRNIMARIQKNHRCDIECFSMPNRYNIPAYISVANQQTTPWISGKGASINREHALLRSLLETEEMLEYRRVYGQEEDQKYQIACQQLQEWPSLKPCIDIDFIRSEEKETFQDQPDSEQPYNHNALRQLKTLLVHHGVKVWVNVVREESPVVLRVHMEGMDEFFAVKDGVPVMPLQSSFL